MFNNIKYKINDEVHNPLVMLSSDLRSSLKECVEWVCPNPSAATPDQTEIFTSYIKLHKSLPLYKRILAIPSLIKAILTFIKSI